MFCVCCAYKSCSLFYILWFSNHVCQFDASEYEKKAVWPGSLFKKTCRRRSLFQHPRKKKAFACYSKAERRVLMMRARAIKARMCSISKMFSPLAITMVFAIERWKKFDEGKYFAIVKVCLVLTAHIFCSLFKCVKSLKRIALPTMKESSKYFSWNSTFLYLWIKFLQHTQKNIEACQSSDIGFGK